MSEGVELVLEPKIKKSKKERRGKTIVSEQKFSVHFDYVKDANVNLFENFAEISSEEKIIHQ